MSQAIQTPPSMTQEDMKSAPGIMPDHWIREQAQNNGMIEPFVEKQNPEFRGR